MVDSGIKPNEDIVKAFNDLKLNRIHKCIILTLDKTNQHLELEFIGDKTFEYKDLVDKLPNNDPRYL